jgi:hypothetical protein
MSLINNLKDVYENERKKSAANKAEYSSRIGFLWAQYVGGFDQYGRQEGSLIFYRDRVVYDNKKHQSITINILDVIGIAVEGKDEILQTRTIARNLLAFGKSKKEEIKEAYVTLTLQDRREVIFHNANLSPSQVKFSLSNAISLIRQIQASQQVSSAVAPQISTADELAKLAKLKEQGVITQTEFDRQKQRLLGV